MATALLEKQEVERQQLERPEPAQYHWTLDAFYRAVNAGIFEEPERLELIQGRIMETMSQNAPHASLRRRLGRVLRSCLEPALLVMEESSLRLALDGEPVPDIIAVTGREEDYEDKHPTQHEARLVMEVSDTTAAYDLGGKALLYAQAGITDYWVVLVNEEAIVVHREPTAEGYQSVTWLAGTDTIFPLAAPEAVWMVEALRGSAERTQEV